MIPQLVLQRGDMVLEYLLRAVGVYHGKLIAAAAEDHAVAQRVPDQIITAADQPVARLMALGVVDPLQAGDVAVEHADGLRVQGSVALNQSVAVEGPGHLVVIAQLVKAAQQIPTLQQGGGKIPDHVEQGGHQAHHLLVGVVHPQKTNHLAVHLDGTGGQGGDVLGFQDGVGLRMLGADLLQLVDDDDLILFKGRHPPVDGGQGHALQHRLLRGHVFRAPLVSVFYHKFVLLFKNIGPVAGEGGAQIGQHVVNGALRRGAGEDLLQALVQNGLAAGVIIGCSAHHVGVHVDGDLHPVLPAVVEKGAVLHQEALAQNRVFVGPGEEFPHLQVLVGAEIAGGAPPLQNRIAGLSHIVAVGRIAKRMAQMPVHEHKLIGLHI